ncbi:c-type cytochrome [Magnetofaba australis]|nr:c-type cytochrome [Magnetofaba australis]
MRVSRLAIAALLSAASLAFAAAPAQAGDAAKGEKLMKKCGACHTWDQGGKKKVGPNLFGVYEQNCGHNAEFKYSDGYHKACEKGFKIDEAMLMEYLADASAYLSGVAGEKVKSKMTFKLKKEADRADVIEFLKGNK